MKDTEAFGKKIRELRLKNDLSLRDLGERSGISYSFINSIEKNRYRPSRETVIALANALRGADKNELLLLAGFSPEEVNESSENYIGHLSEENLHPIKKELIEVIKSIEDTETLKSLTDIAKKILKN